NSKPQTRNHQKRGAGLVPIPSGSAKSYIYSFKTGLSGSVKTGTANEFSYEKRLSKNRRNLRRMLDAGGVGLGANAIAKPAAKRFFIHSQLEHQTPERNGP